MLFDSNCMEKLRIVQRPSALDPSVALYEIEERMWLFWSPIGLFDTLEEAEKRVAFLREPSRRKVKRKVVRIYD